MRLVAVDEAALGRGVEHEVTGATPASVCTCSAPIVIMRLP